MIEITCQEDCMARILVPEPNKPIKCWNCGRDYVETKEVVKTENGIFEVVNYIPSKPTIVAYKPLGETRPIVDTVATVEASIDSK